MYYGDLGTNSYMAKNLIECDLGLEMGRPGKNPRKKNAPPPFFRVFFQAFASLSWTSYSLSANVPHKVAVRLKIGENHINHLEFFGGKAGYKCKKRKSKHFCACGAATALQWNWEYFYAEFLHAH